MYERGGRGHRRWRSASSSGRCREGKWSGKRRLWLVESKFRFVVGRHRGGMGVFVHHTTWGLQWRGVAVGRAVGF